MKTRLTLSTVVFAMLLTPAAFANGAQEQTQEAVVASPHASVAVVAVTVADQPEAAAVSRSVLNRLQQEVREEVANSLRDSGILAEVLQLATPALTEAASGAKSLTAL